MDNRKSASTPPLYLQIADKLRARIQSGELPAGQLPPVRQTAKEAGVNPNTVQRAYSELRKDGIISGTVGKGTFVTTALGLRRQNRVELLRKAIEHAAEEALSLEFTIEEYAGAVAEYVEEKQQAIRNLKLTFIECNIEQLTYFTRHLEIDPHVRKIPVLLDDIRNQDDKALKRVAQADILVTSFYHLDEIHNLFSETNKPIVGVNLEPEMKTLIGIAKIPSESTVGIVTTSEQCKKEIRDILRAANIRFSRLLTSHSSNLSATRKLVGKCNAVLVSPRKKAPVTQSARPGTRVIEFVFVPDKTSINNLRVALLELKKRIV